MNADDIATLNDQIAGMARAGLPLDQGLTSLARDLGRGKLRRVTAALGRDLKDGMTLPEALEARDKELPPFYSSLAKAGLRTGRLPDVLCTLTTYARTITATRAMIIEAVTYPIVVLTLAIGMFSFLFFVVVPQFENTFSGFNMQVPAFTKVFFTMAAQPIWSIVVPAGILVMVLLGVLFVVRWSNTSRQVWAGLLYSIPLIGTMIKTARLAAFVDLLALLVDYSVPLPEALQLAGDASSDPFVAGQARTIRTSLEGGQPLGEALRGQGLLPEWVAWMAASGERRGMLAATLHQIADVYRRQVEARASVLRNVLPSMFIIGTAVFLGFMFIVVLLVPLVQLIEGLAK